MKNKKLLIGLGVIIALAIAAVGIYKNRQQVADDNVIRIGAVLPLTGVGSVAGTYVQEALLFAAGQYGGGNFRVLIEDSKSNPKDAVIAYRKLISDKRIKVVFLQMSSVINTILPISKQDDVLLIGIGSTEPTIEINDTRKYLTNYLDASTQARLFVENAPSKRIALFYLNDDYGLSIKKAMELQLSKDVFESFPFAQSSNAQDLVASITLKNDITVVIAGYGPIMVDISERLLQYGYKGKIICTPEFLVNSNLHRLKDVGENIYVIGMPPLIEDVSKAFFDKVGRNASVADMLAYNGLVCVAEGLKMTPENKGFTAERIVEALKSFSSFENAPAVKCVNGKCFVYDAFVEKVFKDEQ